MLKLAYDIDRCLSYTTDINYALPTVLSAIQARGNLSPRTDVVMLLFGGLRPDIDIFSEVCETERIIFKNIPFSAIDNLSMDYARYFLDEFLEEKYRFVTHVDGDTHILEDLNPLLDFEVEHGRVIAVPDPIALMVKTGSWIWQHHSSRLQQIGLSPKLSCNYVNTGLFQMRRSNLRSFSEECRMLALKEGSRMSFGQQDAFNIALGPIIDLASFRWNYPAFFSNFGFQHLVQPRVRHFMSNPRPWQGPFPPWGAAGHAPYIDLVHRHPKLARSLSPFRGQKRIRYEAQQRIKSFIEPMFWNRKEMHDNVSIHENLAVV